MHHQASSPTKPRPFLWQRAPEEIRAPIDAESPYEDIGIMDPQLHRLSSRS